jgi:hypothetical protein
MRTLPELRTRIPSEGVTGGIVRIITGLFGTGDTRGVAQVNPNASTPIYRYHEGDVFLPGTGNWVFEPGFELPMQTIWGNAFLRKPNTFNPLQVPQLYSNPTVVNNGLGGLQAGIMQLEPLINPEGEAAPFVGDFAVPLEPAPVSEG